MGLHGHLHLQPLVGRACMASFLVFAWSKMYMGRKVPPAKLPSSQSFGKVKWGFLGFIFLFLSVPLSVMTFSSTKLGRQRGRKGGREEKIQGNPLLSHPSSPEVPSQSVFFFQE